MLKTMDSDLASITFSLAMSLMTRGYKTEGQIHVFSDTQHSSFAVNRGGHVKRDCISGDLVNGNMEELVESVLGNPRTIGIATTSYLVFDYLNRTGTLQVEERPHFYEREGRIYDVF